MSKPLVILGSGGHASVVVDILLSQGKTIVATISPDEIKDNSPLKGIKRLVTDSSLLDTYSPEQVDLVNGLGALPGNTLRTKLFDYFSNYGYKFQSVIAPSAIVAGGAPKSEVRSPKSEGVEKPAEKVQVTAERGAPKTEGRLAISPLAKKMAEELIASGFINVFHYKGGIEEFSSKQRGACTLKQ